MTTDAVGGVWNYSLDLARAFEVTLAGMGPRPSSMPPNTHWGDFKLEWQPDPWQDIDRAGEWLLFLEKQFRPDLIHLNGYAHAALPFNAPKLAVAHSCVLSWWEAVHNEPAPPEWNEYRSRVSAGIHAADFVVAPSRAMLDAIAKHFGTPKNSAVIPNGRDPASFHSVDKEPFVFTAGRLWDDAKNILALEKITINWPIYAAGDGQAGGSIRSLGHLPELRDWYARASIYALPARYEPFGLSILEAALSNCALVLGDIPSLRENWNDAAAFVPPNDTNALAAAIQRLIDKPDLLRDLQQRARRRAEQFTLTRMIEAYANLYAALRCRSHPATAFRS
jgi:glycosyltransferase involved in cell wall biosynthesis